MISSLALLCLGLHCTVLRFTIFTFILSAFVRLFQRVFLYFISRFESIYSNQCSLSNYKQNQIRYCFGVIRWIFSTLFMHPNQTKIKPFTRCNRLAVNWYSNMKTKTNLGQKKNTVRLLCDLNGFYFHFVRFRCGVAAINTCGTCWTDSVRRAQTDRCSKCTKSLKEKDKKKIYL